MIKSIVIVRLSALGDALMLVPLVRTLQDNYPDATITWIISKPAYYLVEGMDGVEFIVIDKPCNLKDYWQFYQSMRLKKFDVLLAVQASFRANLLYPLIKARRKIGYDSMRANDGHGLFVSERIKPGKEHTIDGFLKFAEVLGIKKRVIRWDLPIEDNDYEWARSKLPKTNGRPLIIVNPAASKPERSWLVERYIAIISHLQSRWGAEVVLTGGPGQYDKELGDLIADAIPVTNLIGKTRPKQLLALISICDLVLCPDTGPSHMAASVGTPVVALHSVTNPDVSGPYTFRHLVINCYPEAVEKIINKKMEEVAWGTQVHGSHAMDLVCADDVIARFDELLSNRVTSAVS